jgi:hypothetical protein
MGEAEQKLKDEIDALLKRAEIEDAAEDEKFGKGRSGDDLPAELARRQRRLAKLQEARVELEAEARQRAEEKKAAVEARLTERREQEQRTGKKIRGREPQPPDATAQRNFTEAESRIMPSGIQNRGPQRQVFVAGVEKGAFAQGYNAQIAVDGAAQIIVAVDVIQQTTDNHRLAPMLEQTERNVGAWPQAASADTGYWNPEQVETIQGQGIDLHVATGKQKHGETSQPDEENQAEAGKNHLCANG